jgi:uncharacterized protein (TIGR03067 family)
MSRRTGVLVAALFAISLFFAAPLPKDDLTRLNGTWKVTSFKIAGVELIGGENQSEIILTFKNGKFEWPGNDGQPGRVASINSTKTPKQITYEYIEGDNKGKIHNAIYILDRDTFTDCFGDFGEDWPTEFKSTEENKLTMLVYKRVNKVD